MPLSFPVTTQAMVSIVKYECKLSTAILGLITRKEAYSSTTVLVTELMPVYLSRAPNLMRQGRHATSGGMKVIDFTSTLNLNFSLSSKILSQLSRLNPQRQDASEIGFS